jgi:selenobiotic family peptide radical SAM maturase
LPDLAALEWACHAAESADVRWPDDVRQFELNPTLDVLRSSWRLLPVLRGSEQRPESSPQWVLVWRDRSSGEVRVEEAAGEDLLAVKVVADDMTAADAARQGRVAVQVIDALLARAAARGLLIAPRSRLRRDPAVPPVPGDGRYLTAHRFTLQWHVTNACDLHCKHCYDRSDRSVPTVEQGLSLLDDLAEFCSDMRVAGHVCFTGGNPFMHPRFYDLYAGAAARGFETSILGNPVRRGQMERVLAVQRPGYYQVSLEGLRRQTDEIRGEGHYERTMDFLELLRALDVSSAVMLTLTADNIGEVIPLAEELRGRADYFTFNRLSPVGEGAALALPGADAYQEFLAAYVEASRDNAILGFKDNLINAVLHARGMELFGGCTGFGCGAAFNFVAVLPDGEVHACRKFPSPLGSVGRRGIAQLYASPEAARYRHRPQGCRGCDLQAVCGGCFAITRGLGLDMERDRDPYCPVRGPADGA